ncbi:efflux RND transporter periplasmic adaptor subunit, partial [Aquifex sp.]
MLRILPLFFFILLLSCKSQEKIPEKTEGEKVIKVSVVTPQKEKVKIYYTVKGGFEAIKNATIKPEVSGIVEKIFTDEGKFVKKGEKLLKIEDKFLKLELERLKASYRRLLADLEYYRAFYERRKKLYERELIAREAYEEAEKRLRTYEEELKSLKAQIENVKLKIEKSTVRAPFSGYVAGRFVSEGDYVNPSTKLFQIVSLNPI